MRGRADEQIIDVERVQSAKALRASAWARPLAQGHAPMMQRECVVKRRRVEFVSPRSVRAPMDRSANGDRRRGNCLAVDCPTGSPHALDPLVVASNHGDRWRPLIRHRRHRRRELKYLPSSAQPFA